MLQDTARSAFARGGSGSGRGALRIRRGVAAVLTGDGKFQGVPYDPARHHRRSIRFRGFDYTRAGAYFVTMVTHRRCRLFGRVVRGRMWLSPAGEIAHTCWDALPRHFPAVRLDAMVVMPDHMHGIVWIAASAEARETDGTGGAIGIAARNGMAASGGIAPVGIGATAPMVAPVGIVGAQHAAPLQTPTHSPIADSIARRTPTHSPIADSIARRTPTHSPIAGPPPFVPPGSLGAIVRSYKSAVTRAINVLSDRSGTLIWQRNYYEHIVRDDEALGRIRRYIENNPRNWR